MIQLHGVELTMAETATEDRAELGQMADRFREGKRNAVLVLFGTAGRGAIHVTVSRGSRERGPEGG